MASRLPPIQHPYHPPALVLPTTYTPNDTSALTLVFLFASAVLMLASLAVKGAAWRRREEGSFQIGDLAGVVWFVVSGSIHCAFEGYFLWNHDRMPARMDLFGQLWKEYALSDSRYMFSDPMLLCMEMLSVFGLGPLCFITAWLISNDSGYRHSLQALTSTGHLYSNLVYFMTSLYDDYVMGKKYYRPEPVYFWAYFVGMNAIWLVVPAILLYNSMRASAKAFNEVRGTRRKVKDLYNMMKDTKTKTRTNGADKKEL